MFSISTFDEALQFRNPAAVTAFSRTLVKVAFQCTKKVYVSHAANLLTQTGMQL